jgi:hypothetical protein
MTDEIWPQSQNVMKDCPATFALGQSRRILITVSFLVIAILTMIAYFPSLNDGFCRDDYHWMYQGLRGTDSLANLFDPVIGVLRPVVVLVSGLSYRLFGLSPRWHHLFQIGLHLLNSFILLRLVLAITQSISWALLSALLFALQPAPVFALVWISAKASGPLLTCLFLLMILLYWKSDPMGSNRTSRARTAIAYSLSLLAFALCLGTGELALLFPLVLALLQMFMGQVQNQKTGQPGPLRPKLLRLSPFVMLALLWYGWLQDKGKFFEPVQAAMPYFSQTNSPAESFFSLVSQSFGYLFLPYTQGHLGRFWDSGWSDLLGFVAIPGAIIYGVKRLKQPGMLFSLGIFFTIILLLVPFAHYHYPYTWSYHLYLLCPLTAVLIAFFLRAAFMFLGQVIPGLPAIRTIIGLLLLGLLSGINVGAIQAKHEEWRTSEALDEQEKIAPQLQQILNKFSDKLCPGSRVMLYNFPATKQYLLLHNRYSMVSLMARPKLNVDYIVDISTPTGPGIRLARNDVFFGQELLQQEQIPDATAKPVLILQYQAGQVIVSRFIPENSKQPRDEQ